MSHHRAHSTLATDPGEAKLVCRTFLDGGAADPGAICVKVYRFGEGYVEATAYRKPKPATRSGQKGASQDEPPNEENAQRADRRARRSVRLAVMARSLTHLLTLTTRKCITDPGVFWEMWKAFVRQVHQQIPTWQYVAISERQKREAIHIHAAVAGYQDVKLLRKLWLGVLEDKGIRGGGSVHVRAPKNNRRPKMAQYLTKYMAKDFENGARDFGRHRYRASQCKAVEPIVLTASSWRVFRGALEDVFEEFGVAVAGSVYIDSVDAMWACSWDRSGKPVSLPPDPIQRRASHDVYTRP